MEIPLLMLLVLFVITYNLRQGFVAALPQNKNLVVKKQLQLINKPAIKSFVTKHGDILDCVEIDKQLAFDHPLLKNHSIQMKPNFEISKRTKSNDFPSSIVTPSQLLPKNMKCPKGTVLVKRILEEDLAMEKFSKLLVGTTISTSNSSKKRGHSNDAVRYEVAALVTNTQNTGAAGVLNLWSPEVKPDQFSGAFILAGNDDGSGTNQIVIGWAVFPYLYQNFTRLYTYWTKDSGKSTGCYNALCPGFVQTSKKVTLGQVLSPTSKYGSDHQYFVDLTLRQDVKTKNWWLVNGEENVGYWPKELFTSLANGANNVGWGGEVQSPVNEATPGMGSSHVTTEGYGRACLMKNLQLFAPQGFPGEKDLKRYLTSPKCYGCDYGSYFLADPAPGQWGNFIFFGGPPDCKA